MIRLWPWLRKLLEALSALLGWFITPFRLLWGEIIGLRTEQIRSLSVMTGIVFLFRGYDHMEHGDDLLDPHVIVTLICLVMTFGLAWQATKIKGQIAGAQFELGNGGPAQSMMAQPVETLPTPPHQRGGGVKPDNPDGEK